MKNLKSLIWYLLLVGTICIVNFTIKWLHPETRNSDPIFWWGGIWVIMVFLLSYLLYSWKSKFSEFLKRIRIAIPFGLAFLIFIRVLGFENRAMVVGVFICLLLLLKTTNWKTHFEAVLIPASIFIILLKFLLIPLLSPGSPPKNVYLGVFFLAISGMPILSFYSLYMSKVLDSKTLDMKVILVRSVKFSIAACILVGTTIFVSNYDRQYLSFPIQLIINTLLAILFLVVCYKFDLFLIERKNIWKTERAGECECCGKRDLPQELLFKIDSGQRVCADCLAKMDNT